jgi:hypothetical protein
MTEGSDTSQEPRVAHHGCGLPVQMTETGRAQMGDQRSRVSTLTNRVGTRAQGFRVAPPGSALRPAGFAGAGSTISVLVVWQSMHRVLPICGR